ncbi:MAG: hypothetical protein B0W54_23560 [Cellvibrio sp. 79]|nr:MAG: hypothetical protein B0W54_23560 [Cellvibrio sp. 79]
MYPNKNNSPLATAEKAANSYSDSQPVGAATMPCPNDAQELKEVIRVKVVGEDGVGLGGIALQLSRADKKILTGKTAPDGVYAFKGLDAGNYQLSLPELDKDAWKELTTESLPADEAKSSSVASWQSAPAQNIEEEKIHIIKQGECVGKIAEVYGFFPKTIWEYGKNAELKKLRHDEMYILFEKDEVVIPAKREKARTVAAGVQLTVQRQGVPEYLHIRFLNYDETPRIEVPYLLSLKTDKGILVADAFSKTDDKGFVNQPIPPSAVNVTIILNPGPWSEVHEFNLGYINPIDNVSGWQARLNNLGYDCGAEDNKLGPKTQAAIRAFQRTKKLKETGDRNKATETALLAIALS